MNKRILRRILVPLVLLAAVGGVLVASGRLGGQRKDPNLLTLYGNVDIRQVELGFRVAGRIAAMNFEEGQSVKAGEPMATLDPRAFEAEVRGAAAQVAAQEAALAKLVAGPRAAEIARARAAVHEATASATNAQRSLERARHMNAAGAVTQASFDDAQTGSSTSEARLASAKDALRLMVQGSRTEDIAGGRASLEGARARLAAAQTALDDTRLLAPTSGVVLSRVREPGAIVSPNDIAYVVALTRPVWVRAYAPEPELGKLHPGMEAEVLFDAAPGRPQHGRLGFISPTAEFTPKSVETPELRTNLVYRLRIIIDDPDPGLRQGMPVTVRIRTGQAR